MEDYNGEGVRFRAGAVRAVGRRCHGYGCSSLAAAHTSAAVSCYFYNLFLDENRLR